MLALVHRLTTLVRFVDLRYRSNRSVLAVSLAGGLVGYFVLAPDGQAPGASSAIAFAGAAFLSWAMGRELDPDEPASALVGALLALGVTAILGAPDLVVLLGVLAVARFLLRSVGPPPTVLDMMAIAALGVFLGSRPGGWPVALVLAFAVARDRTLPGEPGPFGRMVALIVAAGSTGLAIAAGVGFWVRPSGVEWGVAIAGLVAGALMRPTQPLSPTDVGGMVLIGRRLASARRLTMAALLLTIAFSGASGIVAAGGGYAALFAVFVVQRQILPVGSGRSVIDRPDAGRGADDVA